MESKLHFMVELPRTLIQIVKIKTEHGTLLNLVKCFVF